jgi:hypothetical protein
VTGPNKFHYVIINKSKFSTISKTKQDCKSGFKFSLYEIDPVTGKQSTTTNIFTVGPSPGKAMVVNTNGSISHINLDKIKFNLQKVIKFNSISNQIFYGTGTGRKYLTYAMNNNKEIPDVLGKWSPSVPVVTFKNCL